MEQDRELRTPATLLGRICQPQFDQGAWAEFVARYGPRIYGWCRHWQLQEADAQDVTQNVLLQLAQKLRHFRYDPTRSFRAWLKTVAHHAWRDFLAARQKPGLGSGDRSVLDWLQSRPADELALQLEEAFDREVLEEAMARVRLRVAPHTWEAFRLLAFDGLAGAEVAPRVKMQVAMVYVARSKVQKMIRQEIEKLERREEEP